MRYEVLYRHFLAGTTWDLVHPPILFASLYERALASVNLHILVMVTFSFVFFHQAEQ